MPLGLQELAGEGKLGGLFDLAYQLFKEFNLQDKLVTALVHSFLRGVADPCARRDTVSARNSLTDGF